ncbi:MAG: (2Fe-2S) ferredoxin domain-containing protein [Cyanobacteria bacterium J06623_4]
MQVLQGKYLEQVTSPKGNLKALKIETSEGIQTIHLPKALREIAQQELVLGDTLRVWSTAKGNDKEKEPCALQLIPLNPKASLPVPTDTASKTDTQKDEKVRSPKKSELKKSKQKKAKKQMTVQLCQKKNCCKKGGTKLWQTFEQVAQSNSSDQPVFTLEAVGCLGGCKRGPNLRVLPGNTKHYHVQPKDVQALLKKHRQ